jgi:hypothetical protein
MSQKPVANAVLICDKVITEEGTKKKSLIGIFENIGSSKFPCVHYFLSVYVKLTDARGKYKFSLDLVNLETGNKLNRAEIPREVEVPDPLRTHELVFNMGGLKFPSPGKYEFRVMANDEIFGQKTFLVEELKKRDPQNEQEA